MTSIIKLNSIITKSNIFYRIYSFTLWIIKLILISEIQSLLKFQLSSFYIELNQKYSKSSNFTQGQIIIEENDSKIREYFYHIDHQGNIYILTIIFICLKF